MATIGGDERCQEHWASLKRCRGNVDKINVTDVGKMLRTLIIKKFKGQRRMLGNMSKTSSSTKGITKGVRQH
jgi:hypothetical protein